MTKKQQDTAPQETVEAVGLSVVAGWLDMEINALQVGMQRHPNWPAPSVTISPGRRIDMNTPDRGWLPSTRDAWKAWRASWPGRGAGGGRPPGGGTPKGVTQDRQAHASAVYVT
jgi:hypothetical protein